MLRFRSLSDQQVHVYARYGHPDSMLVEPGQEVDVPGTLVTSRPKPKGDEPEPEPLPEDAYVVAQDGEERLWPHANWELVADKPAKTVKEN